MGPIMPARNDTLVARRWLETAGRITPDQPDSLPLEEQEAVDLVMRFLDEAKNCEKRKKAKVMWEEADRLVDGNHWEGRTKGMQRWQAKLVINRCFSTHEKTVSLLVDGLPEVEVTPRMADDEELAAMLDGFILHERQQKNWDFTIASVYSKAVAHRVAWLKTFWDAKGEGGRGCIELEPVDNYHLYLHPNAKIRGGKLKSKFAIHHFKMSRGEILSKYGVDPVGEYQRNVGTSAARYVNKKPRPAIYLDRANEMNTGGSHRSGGGSEGRGIADDKSPNDVVDENNLDVYECWYEDDSRIETGEVSNTAGGLPPLKYPTGRIITICNSFLLYDSPNPLGFNGFVPITVSADPDRIYGPSLINQIAHQQYELNESRSQMSDHRKLCCNPIKRITAQSSIRQETATNRPGMTYTSFDPEGGIDFIEPPKLGPEVLQSAQLSNQEMDDVSGSHEVSQGEASSDARSGVAIERLQVAGMTRTNLKSLFSDAGVKVTYENVISMFIDFVEDTRKYRFIDQQTYMMEYGNFDPSKYVNIKRSAIINDLTQVKMGLAQRLENLILVDPLRSVDLDPIIRAKIAEIDHEIQVVRSLPAHDLVSLDVMIQVGTRYQSKTATITQGFQMYEVGEMDGFHLHKLVGLPGWQKIWKRVQEAKQLAAEAEAAAMEEEHARQLELEDTKIEGSLDEIEEQGEVDAELAEQQAELDAELEDVKAENQIEIDDNKAEEQLKIEKLKAETQARALRARQQQQSKKAA